LRVLGIPQRSLLDEKLTITLEDLPPESEVDLRLQMTNGLNLNFQSPDVTFKSDAQGRICLDAAVPLNDDSGLYGDSMGIFRNLKPLSGSDRRFWSSDVKKAFDCSLTVSAEGRGRIGERYFQRVHMGEGVSVENVRYGRLRAKLFLPDPARVEKPVTPVITLHGGIFRGAPVQEIASVLASRGVPALAVAYFGIAGLPKRWMDKPLDLNYFEEALDFLRDYGGPSVASDGAKLWGISKGGEVAMCMTAAFPDRVKALVVINAPPQLVITSATYDDRVVFEAKFPQMKPPTEISRHVLSLQGWDEGMDGDPAAFLPIWKSEAPALLLASEADMIFNARRHMTKMYEVAKSHGKRNVLLKTYPQMGHLADLPYVPATSVAPHPMAPKPYEMYYGGDDLAMHAKGTEELWRDVLRFFQMKCDT